MAPQIRFDPTDAANEADAVAVAELLAVFDSSLLTREGMSLTDLLDLYYTIRDLEKCIKTVRPIVVQGNFDGVWAKACTAGVVASAQTLTLRDLFRFRTWVISPPGQASLRAFQHERKQKRKKLGIGNAVTVNVKGKDSSESEQERETALLRLFTAQKEDPVPSGYVAPDAAFVRQQCWDMYAADAGCQAEGRRMASVREVEERYGQVVRDRHLLAYLHRPEVKEALLAYGRDKLLTLRDEGNRRGFTEFRGILEIASGGSVPLPDEISPVARGEDSEVASKGNRKRKHTSAQQEGTR